MDSLSRISGIMETARDLTLEAARDAASSRLSAPTRPLPPQALKKLLDSRRDAEVLDGLRRVIAMHYTPGQPSTLPYFTAVIKNVASPHLEVKKLVYAFLIQHAEAEPDTALLSINTIQKGLSDASPGTRALALRTMSSIRVPVISQIVALGIKRGAGDMAPAVRKAAALAIPKCYALDPSQEALLVEQIGVLLADRQYFVVGAAVAAFERVCPDRWDLIHPVYKGLVKKLVDMDEWGQCATLRMVLRYCRHCFPRRTQMAPKHGQTQKKSKDFYDEDETDGDQVETEEVAVLDPDLELLLKSIQPLLQSRNSAVIIAVARSYLYLGLPSHIALAAGPLISVLRATEDISSLTLSTIAALVRSHPTPFTPYTTHFLLRASDPEHAATQKLTILSLLYAHVSASLRSIVLTDLAHHTKSTSSPSLVRASVLALGRCASSSPTPALRSRCLHLLLTHLSSPDPALVSASLDEIRLLIQSDPGAHEKTIVRLAKHLDGLTAPQARGTIVWLVGEYASSKDSVCIAADVWRILIRGFADETFEVQGQILLLACKVYLHHKRGNMEDETAVVLDDAAVAAQPQDDRIDKLLAHTFLLVRYAQSFKLRDRARFLKGLVVDAPSTDLAALMLFQPKPSPRDSTLEDITASSTSRAAIGTASWMLGVDLRGADAVPPWTEHDVGVEERRRAASSSSTPSVSAGAVSAADRLDQDAGVDSDISYGKATNGGDKGKAPKTLDQWLEESGEEKDSDEEEESDEEDDDEGESGSEEDSDEESEYETDSEDDEDDEDENDDLIGR